MSQRCQAEHTQITHTDFEPFLKAKMQSLSVKSFSIFKMPRKNYYLIALFDMKFWWSTRFYLMFQVIGEGFDLLLSIVVLYGWSLVPNSCCYILLDKGGSRAFLILCCNLWPLLEKVWTRPDLTKYLKKFLKMRQHMLCCKLKIL